MGTRTTTIEPECETFARNDNNKNKNGNNIVPRMAPKRETFVSSDSNNYSLIRDDPNIHQRVGTLRKKEYSPTPWEEFNLANAGLDISHTQLSRPIP